MEKSKVYFSKEITPENVVKIYEKLGKKLHGKVAVKVHSGEKGNQNYLHPEFMKPMVEHVNGTIVECNTAYAGQRNSTEKHLKLLEEHEWSKYFDVDIMDAEEDLKNERLHLKMTNLEILKEKLYSTNIYNEFVKDTDLKVSYYLVDK